MLKDLNEDQAKLAEFMSWISEEGYSAGWMDTLEFDLWDIINGGNRKYGRHELTQNDIDQLHSLSQKCGCWIIYDNVNDEKAVDLKSWEIMFAHHRKENKRRC